MFVCIYVYIYLYIFIYIYIYIYIHIYNLSYLFNVSIYILKGKRKMFLRFIDDLFMIWTDSEQELLDFMSDLNKKLHRSNLNSSTHKQKLNS